MHNPRMLQTYISPYLFGRRPKRKPVDESLAELGAAVSSCAADLRTLRSGVDALTADRAAEMVVNTRLQEIKSEVTSLKSLLLNRYGGLFMVYRYSANSTTCSTRTTSGTEA